MTEAARTPRPRLPRLDGALGAFLRTNILVVLVSNLGNAANYLTQVVSGRCLSLEAFGTVNAVLSLNIVVSFWGALFPLVLVKHIVAYEREPALLRLFLRRAWRVTLLAAAAAGGAAVLLHEPTRRYLNVEDAAPVLLLALLIPLGVLHAYLIGLLQGFRMYVGLALNLFTASALRLGLVCVLLAGLGLSAVAALGAVAASTAAAIAIAWAAVRHRVPAGVAGAAPCLPAGLAREIAAFSAPAALMWLAYLILSNVDIVLVKHFCPPEDAGLFSGAAVIARIGLFVPGVLVGLLFAQVRRDMEAGGSGAVSALVVMGMTLAISAAFLSCVAAAPGLILRLFFGSGFGGARTASAETLLVIVSATMCLISSLNVLFNYLMAKQCYAFLWPTYACIAGMLAAIYGWAHRRPADIAWTMLAAVSALTVICLAMLVRSSSGTLREAAKAVPALFRRRMRTA